MRIIYGITIIIYCMLAIILYTLLYIKKEQKQTGKEGQKRKQNGRERGLGQRMPPPSSPVPRLSSVPSAVRTVRTIASAHRPHHRTQYRASGRAGPCPLLGDVIATTSPANNRGSSAGLSAILPPLACVPLSLSLL